MLKPVCVDWGNNRGKSDFSECIFFALRMSTVKDPDRERGRGEGRRRGALLGPGGNQEGMARATRRMGPAAAVHRGCRAWHLTHERGNSGVYVLMVWQQAAGVELAWAPVAVSPDKSRQLSVLMQAVTEATAMVIRAAAARGIVYVHSSSSRGRLM